MEPLSVKSLLFSILLVPLALLGKTAAAGEQGAADHWAYLPLADGGKGSIDEFVVERLKASGLQLSPRVEPDRLLRRTHLLIVGLPPTPEELAQFRRDSSADAYAAVVDDLLARPGFGERWARHWLDLVRYADSSGMHEDSDRPHAWRYRDYVIASFNADKPYGEFITEQIAGDIVAPDSPEAWVATGFCRTGPTNEKNVALAELESYRLEQLDGILATVSGAFLAQTISCARCHDHKTEPITSKDYYSLLSVFQNTSDAYVSFEEGVLGEAKLYPIKARNKAGAPGGEKIRALADLPGEKWKPTHILNRGDVKQPGEEVGAAIPGLLRHMGAEFSMGEPPRLALAKWIASPENPLTWRVMSNRVWKHLFGRGLVGTPSNFGLSGDGPTHPELLDYLAAVLRDSGGRIKPLIREICLSRTFQQDSAFAESSHAANPDNDLLWRYPRHRLEAEVIRDAILASSGNINREMGGEGIKPRIPAEALGQSKRNQWPRVEEETGKHWRRSVYIYQKRQLPMPMMALLDAPDMSENCSSRFSSTTPTQALALLNEEFVNEQARYAADRVAAGHPESAVRALMELVWSRKPDGELVMRAEKFLESEEVDLADVGVALFNSSHFVYVD